MSTYPAPRSKRHDLLQDEEPESIVWLEGRDYLDAVGSVDGLTALTRCEYAATVDAPACRCGHPARTHDRVGCDPVGSCRGGSFSQKCRCEEYNP